MDQDLLDEIMTKVQEFVANNNETGFRHLLGCFDKMYYNSDGGIDDQLYDQIVDIYDKHFSIGKKTYHQLKGVGATATKNVDTRKDVKLPYHMGTILKFSAMLVGGKKVKGVAGTNSLMSTVKSDWRRKPTDYERKFQSWKDKYPGPYTLEGKADGISCLLIYSKKNGKVTKNIYTRGTGTTGKDVSRYLGTKGFKFIPNIDDDLVVRGELVMRYSVWKRKYSNDFSNPRNIVSGFVTRKKLASVDPRDIEFVAYEMLLPRTFTRFEQIQELKNLGFVTVETTQVTKQQLTQTNLFSTLMDFRDKSPYDIDGLVVFDDSKVRPVSKTEVLASAFAYKVNVQTAVVEVVGVEWNPSTTGALKPVVIYKPVTIGRKMPDGSIVGAEYRRATAFNANFIKQNKIGKGSELLIVRSGDVIPHIEQCMKKAKKADLPDVAHAPNPKYEYIGHPKIEYEWGDGANRRSTMDIFTINEMDETKIQRLDLFFSGGRSKRGMNVKGLAKKTLELLFKNGFQTITSILQASEDDLKLIGMGDKTAKNVTKEIKKVLFTQPVDLARLMGATQIFPHARGRTVQKILNVYPDIMTKKYKKLQNVHGVGQDTLDSFLKALPKFKQFLVENPQITYKANTTVTVTGPLNGKTFVFTGTMASMKRADAQELVKISGGKNAETINSKVTHLVIGDKGGGGSKATKATNLGITIISETDFVGLF